MTDEERMAVALVRLRLWGMHPSWVDFVKSESTLKNMESLADIVEQQPETYAFAKRPRIADQE